MLRILGVFATVLIICAKSLAASPFAEGWELESAASELRFSADATGSEAATFSTDVSGTISSDGAVNIAVSLDAINSGDKLRDARVRYLLFESFRLPQATVKATIDPQLVAGLRAGDRVQLSQPLTLTLNAVSQEIDAALDLTVIAQDVIVVALQTPIVLDLADFGYLSGLETLKRVSKADILPKTEVTFELLFQANSASDWPVTLDVAQFNACAQQIKTIGQSDQVYFTSGSVELETKSFPLLDAIAETMESCPDVNLRIEGHTDDRGPAQLNRRLSVGRAAEVVIYLANKGVDPNRLNASGFGEDRPIADNATRRGRWQNRRIEFIPLRF